MTRLSLALLATLALGGTALATEQPGASGHAPGHEMKDGQMKSGNKMQGSPNAAGFDKSKSDTTGSTAPGQGSGAASATSSDSKVKQ